MVSSRPSGLSSSFSSSSPWGSSHDEQRTWRSPWELGQRPTHLRCRDERIGWRGGWLHQNQSEGGTTNNKATTTPWPMHLSPYPPLRANLFLFLRPIHRVQQRPARYRSCTRQHKLAQGLLAVITPMSPIVRVPLRRTRHNGPMACPL